jgi:hypothetical protein
VIDCPTHHSHFLPLVTLINLYSGAVNGEWCFGAPSASKNRWKQKSGVIFHFFGATSSSAKPTEDRGCD